MTPLGELTPLPRPGSKPSPKLHTRSQHFGLPASAVAEETEDPQVTVEPSEPCYTTADTFSWSRQRQTYSRHSVLEHIHQQGFHLPFISLKQRQQVVSATPSSQSVSARWLIPNKNGCWQARKDASNLQRVVTQPRPDRVSNSRLLDRPNSWTIFNSWPTFSPYL